jgi:hypothetical protein
MDLQDAASGGKKAGSQTQHADGFHLLLFGEKIYLQENFENCKPFH